MERVRSLDAQPHLPESVRETVRGHLERHERWVENRAWVDGFLDWAGQVEHDYGRQADRPPDWRQDADEVLEDAWAFRWVIPERKLVAHLSATGAGPGAVEETAAKIGNRIREDEQARALAAERARIAAEHLRAAQEAERLRLEEERRQERSQGGGMSMS